MTRRDHRQPLTLDAIKAKCTEEGDCWLWDGYATQGMPQIRVNMVARPARRVVYELARGDIPPKHHIGVRCECGLCLNPEHLVARRKLRTTLGQKLHADTRMRITRARRARSKLTWDDIRAIRASDEHFKVLDVRYGLSRGYSNKIRRNEVWREAGPFAGLLRPTQGA